MDWGEKAALGGLAAVVILGGMSIYEAWPALVTHPGDSVFIGIFDLIALFGAFRAYTSAPKKTVTRTDRLATVQCVILGWALTFHLIGKIGGHVLR